MTALSGWPALHETSGGHAQNGCSSRREFTIQKVRAVRAFNVDAHGRLRSPSYDGTFIFRPGENVAKCNTGGHVNTPPRRKFSECTCGFYVWHRQDKAGEYAGDAGAVIAVVDVYGKVDVGVLGARAEKLEIVALAPASTGRSKHLAFRVLEAIDARIGLGWPILAMLLLSCAGLGYFIKTVVQNPNASAGWAFLLIPSLVGMILFGGILIGGLAEDGASIFRPDPLSRGDDGRESQMSDIRHNYPGVEVLKSSDELMKRYRVTGPQTIKRTPETDPDFWEKP